MTTIEFHVQHVLRALKLGMGASKAAATQWATTNLAEGVKRFTPAFKKRRDHELGKAEGLVILKEWVTGKPAPKLAATSWDDFTSAPIPAAPALAPASAKSKKDRSK